MIGLNEKEKENLIFFIAAMLNQRATKDEKETELFLTMDQWAFIRSLEIKGSVEEVEPKAPSYLDIFVGKNRFIGYWEPHVSLFKIDILIKGVGRRPFLTIRRDALQR